MSSTFNATKAFILSAIAAVVSGMFAYYLIECHNAKKPKKDQKNAIGYSIGYALAGFLIMFALLYIFSLIGEKGTKAKAYVVGKGWYTPRGQKKVAVVQTDD